VTFSKPRNKIPRNGRGRRLVELTNGCWSERNSQGLPSWMAKKHPHPWDSDTHYQFSMKPLISKLFKTTEILWVSFATFPANETYELKLWFRTLQMTSQNITGGGITWVGTSQMNTLTLSISCPPTNPNRAYRFLSAFGILAPSCIEIAFFFIYLSWSLSLSLSRYDDQSHQKEHRAWADNSHTVSSPSTSGTVTDGTQYWGGPESPGRHSWRPSHKVVHSGSWFGFVMPAAATQITLQLQ